LELEKIENIQRSQFAEFTAAWDTYMLEYEAAAYQSLCKLREKHDVDIVVMR
tara:strand:+ start:223 stop:378 length:156 start_codon:yes stop_codon:yes gene_type:complete